MDKINIIVEKHGIKPTRAHKYDAGMDLYAPYRMVLYPGDRETVLIGVRVQIPSGYTGFIKAKSGLFRNRGILTTGVIDSEYTGEIGITLLNTSEVMQIFEKGDKIAQLEIHKCELPEVVIVDEFPETERGSNGFGSSGR